MKQSQYFLKTTKDIAADTSMKSHEYLYRGSFIRESVAGRYYFLPLGMRVKDKIIAIIEEEMNAVGAQKILTPTLHKLELWEETNRTSSTGFELMTVKDRRDMEFALGGTAEEMIVDLIRKFNISYRDLPFNVYQFSNKFRDELRARGGLMRVREFIMKDAYSFHDGKEDFERYYKIMWESYIRIFNRLGLEVDVVEADNGYIGGDYSHEFQARHPQGEGRYFTSDASDYAAHEDVATAAYDMVNPGEAIKGMEIIEQPQWVCTMEENEKHYGKDARHFLKNVVYKTAVGDLIIVTIRGDLDVNKTKLEAKMNLVGQIEEATDADLESIGTKSGYVHSWGHDFVNPTKTTDGERDAKVIYVADESLKTVVNFTGGQKEDTTDSNNVNYGRDFTHDIELDVAVVQEGMTAPDGSGGKLVEHRGIEVGNIFQLGTHYSDLMNATYTAESGEEIKYYMGCYGIGIGRTLASIVEAHSDDRGIMWPESVAPFAVHLLVLGADESVKAQADELYGQMIEKGIEVLYDDRDLRPGEKFADADLIGIPTRVVLSEKSLAAGGVEVKKRGEEESTIVVTAELLAKY